MSTGHTPLRRSAVLRDGPQVCWITTILSANNSIPGLRVSGLGIWGNSCLSVVPAMPPSDPDPFNPCIILDRSKGHGHWRSYYETDFWWWSHNWAAWLKTVELCNEIGEFYPIIYLYCYTLQWGHKGKWGHAFGDTEAHSILTRVSVSPFGNQILYNKWLICGWRGCDVDFIVSGQKCNC